MNRRKTPSATRPEDILCGGGSCTDWANAAACVHRAAVTDKKNIGVKAWADYPQTRYAWVTDHGAFVCVGTHIQATQCKRERSDELRGQKLCPIALPFTNGGRELKRLTGVVIAMEPLKKKVA